MSEFEQFCAKLKEDIYNSSKIQANGCVVWDGSKTSNGFYGNKRVTWPDGTRETKKVHQLIMITKLLTREIPKYNPNHVKMEISHLCQVSLCVNPGHLELETHGQNCERKHCQLQNVCTKGHTPHCIL